MSAGKESASVDQLAVPVRSRSSVDQLVDRVLTAIALGQLGVGDRLPAERELATQTGVSRNTVRDAIGRLVATGVVEVRRGRTGGAFVRESWSSETASAVRRSLDADWPQLKSLLDLHSLIEGMVAATAAERARAADHHLIREAVNDHAKAKDARDIRATDLELHLRIARATQNPYLVQLRDRIAADVGLRIGSDPYVDDPAVTRRARRQHKALAEAIRAKDPVTANAVARRHFAINVDAVEGLRAKAASHPGGR